MATYLRICFSQNLKVLKLNFSTSSFVSNKWRRQQGLEANPRNFGPLTNLPDYSFLDGRPVPLSSTKLNKLLHQQEICKKIVELSHELDVGLELYYQKEEQKRKEKELIKSNKLKPKGAALLAKKNKTVASKS